jgi:glycosyltransferase involved in cell wall biosynthesis
MKHNTHTFTAKRKLMIIADAGADTGFAQVTHNLIENLFDKWDIHVLAINYQGDPHPLQSKAKMYNPSAKVQGDFYGINRVAELTHKVQPDVMLLINDPWVASSYQPIIEKSGYKGAVVLYTPIDGHNVMSAYIEPLNNFTHAVGYTQFGVDQLRKGGLLIPATVIPHGVNKKLWKPTDKAEAREKQGFPDDWYIVNVTDRNQIRKRIDLAFYYFAQWVHSTNKPESVKLHYHGGMKDSGWDLLQLAESFGISKRLIISHPDINSQQGIPLELMPYFYAPADVGLSTTMGEGWGLTTHERMAMRIPMIVPEYSALGEWAKGGVHYTRVSDIPYFNIGSVNTKGGVPDMQSTVDALEALYVDKDYRDHIAQKGYELATQSKFSWRTIALQFNDVFNAAINTNKELQKDGTNE